jgi:hypothetical protein
MASHFRQIDERLGALRALVGSSPNMASAVANFLRQHADKFSADAVAQTDLPSGTHRLTPKGNL